MPSAGGPAVGTSADSTSADSTAGPDGAGRKRLPSASRSVAAPMVHGAILKADAARMVGEAHNLSLATYDYLIENGSFPASSPAGTVPPELASMLSANFPFEYKDVTYQWISIAYPDRNNAWNTRNLGILLFNYATRTDMAEPMSKYAGQDAYWSPTHFYFVYRG